MQATPYLIRMITVALAMAGCSSIASGQGIGRLEIHAIPSVTVSNQQFLTGNQYGKPVIIGGELRLPQGTAQNYPAVILIHGSGGGFTARPPPRRWVRTGGVRPFFSSP